jgi:hypothetical protein
MRLVALAFTLFIFGCKSDLKVIPVSPFEDTTINVFPSKTYYFAIDNFSNKDFEIIDSIVLSKLSESKDFIKDGKALNFLFYKYKKGIIDENFIHREDLKQQNIHLGESNSELLFGYYWLHGKFMYVTDYRSGSKLLKRDW